MFQAQILLCATRQLQYLEQYLKCLNKIIELWSIFFKFECIFYDQHCKRLLKYFAASKIKYWTVNKCELCDVLAMNTWEGYGNQSETTKLQA